MRNRTEEIVIRIVTGIVKIVTNIVIETGIAIVIATVIVSDTRRAVVAVVVETAIVTIADR